MAAKGKRDISLELQRELYRYTVVSRGPAKVLYEEFEEAQRAGRNVAFSFVDIVFFFCTAAASGIIGNFAYAVVKDIAQRVRQPKRESIGTKLRFETVISERTYTRLRREQGKVRRSSFSTSALERKLKKKYESIVRLEQKH